MHGAGAGDDRTLDQVLLLVAARLAEQSLPTIRDTQFYSNAADEGLSVFEFRDKRARQYAEEWSGLTAHLEQFG
jgi:hypothetical protein